MHRDPTVAQYGRRGNLPTTKAGRNATYGVLLMLVAAAATHGSQAKTVAPIGLCPENPHYLQWRGSPRILITSAEHYGAVLNSAFDYEKYLRKLQQLKVLPTF